MAIQTKYQKDLADGKIKPKPVVKAPVVVNNVRPSLPTASKAPAGNPYQNIYAAPKAPVALAPAPVKNTSQNLPVYRGPAPPVQPQAQLVKPQQQQGLLPAPLREARAAALANIAATGTGNMQFSRQPKNLSGTTPPPPAWGNPKNQDMAGAGKTPDSWYTAAPKAFVYNKKTVDDLYVKGDIKGLQYQFANLQQAGASAATLNYVFNLIGGAQEAAKQTAGGIVPYEQTPAGMAHAQQNYAINAASQQGYNVTNTAQQQQNAMAINDANIAAQKQIAAMQYGGRDDGEYNQMVEMYQALQQQMMALQNTYIQSLIDRDKAPVVPVVPPPVLGPTPFTPPSFAPSAQTGAYAEFNDVGLGALNTMNPSNLQALRQMMAARGYTGTGAQGRYGERTWARPGGSGALGITDADFENPLNYSGISPADRENAEAALRWFLGQSGYSSQYAFPGMPTYPTYPPVYEMPPIGIDRGVRAFG